MVKFHGFPEDGGLWMVKSIDRFRLPHAATESASVDVRLQRVVDITAQEASGAAWPKIRDLFGSNRRGPEDFRTARVHVGSLPALRAGQLFQNGEYRAELPTEIITVELPHAERSGRARDLDELLSPPAEWLKRLPDGKLSDRQMPYRQLLAKEFDLNEADWRHQKVLVLNRGGQDVIIPRMVIFQRCYAPHSEMADAFASGAWEEVRRRLVSDADFENGLKTRAAPELNEWHLVLETLIPNAFKWHVALFYFDPYAQQQARALYSEAQVQRARRMHDPYWFCTATLPFSPEYPLSLRLKGYNLRPVPGRPMGAFLVTSILAAKPGQPLPRLAYGRANAGYDSPDVMEADALKPFGGKEERSHKNSDRRKIDSTYAPPTGGAVAGFFTDTFEWEGNLQERVLEKTSSKRYTGGSRPPAEPGTGPDSTARPVAGGQAGRHLQMTPLVRPRIAHFENLVDCLKTLANELRIDRFNVVQPEDTDLGTERDGRIVWDLGGHGVKQFNHRPKRWWRMITPRGRHDSPLQGRTVLIVDVEWTDTSALLFEVECRPSEQGYRLAAMFFQSGQLSMRQNLCTKMVRKIVVAEGRHLGKDANSISLEQGGYGAAYRHRYVVEGGQKRLDPDSFMAFLDRARARMTAGASAAAGDAESMVDD